jgi:hypothetical protein
MANVVKEKKLPVLPFTFELTTQERVEYLASLMLARIEEDLTGSHEILLRAREQDATNLRTHA